MEGHSQVVKADQQVATPDQQVRVPYAAVIRSLATRPDLWVTAAKAGLSLAPIGWWRRPPFLPVPSRSWLHFRLVTAYGGDGAELQTDDLITWLEWRKQFPE